MLPIIWLDHNHVRSKLAEKLIKENQLQAYVVRSDDSFGHFLEDIKPAQIIVFLDKEDAQGLLSSVVELTKNWDCKLRSFGSLDQREMAESLGFSFKGLPVDPFKLLGII